MNPETCCTQEKGYLSAVSAKVSIPDLNIRKGSGTDKVKTGKYIGKGVFIIVEETDGLAHPNETFEILLVLCKL